MSELTSCNYCTYQRIKDRAEREGKTFELKDAGNMGQFQGKDVLVDGEWVGWFMELSDYCCC